MGNETGEATKRSNSEPQTFEGMVSFIFLVRLKCFPEIEVQRVTYYPLFGLFRENIAFCGYIMFVHTYTSFIFRVYVIVQDDYVYRVTTDRYLFSLQNIAILQNMEIFQRREFFFD